MSINPEMLFWAFRYALGRTSYTTDDVSTELIRHWQELRPTTQERIVFEIKEAIESNMAGHDCYIARWKAVVKHHEEKTDGNYEP